MTRKKTPPKPVQKWWATVFVFFAPEVTHEFLPIGLPSIRANTEADATDQAIQYINRNYYDIATESYRVDDEERTRMLPWKLFGPVELPELFAKRLESEWQYEQREKRREAKISTSQKVTILDFPLRPPVVDESTLPPDTPDKPKE